MAGIDTNEAINLRLIYKKEGMHSQGSHQVQKQTQTQNFTPQLGQSLEILQVSALELRNVILAELESNPVLEELQMEGFSLEVDGPGVSSEDLDFKEEYSTLQKIEKDWSSGFEQRGAGERYSEEDGERRQHFLDSVTTEKSLQETIIEQAKLSECTEGELQAMEFLVGSLDDKGFLISSILEISKISGLPVETLARALEVLKYLEPIGIGCLDVQECLLVQLKVAGREKSRAAEIIRDHYPLLLRRRIPELAKELGLTVEEVQEILEEISTLDPAPGRRFKADSNRTVVADAKIEKLENNWVISLNSEYIPRLRLSKTYKDLIAKGHLTEKEKEYIQEKMRSGKFILNAIEQRQKTLTQVTEGILKFQRGFFDKGVSELHPLTMSELGVYLKMHETTVSRAVANKFLETPYGLFPYKYFFTTGYNVTEVGDGISSTSIKEVIAKIVQMEPMERPYSDQKMVELLKGKGIKIARRTVAKYREELGIVAGSLRKKY